MTRRRCLLSIVLGVILVVILTSVLYLKPKNFIPSRSSQFIEECKCPETNCSKKVTAPTEAIRVSNYHKNVPSKHGGNRSITGAHIFLLTMVLTATGNRDRRDAIRETWKNSYVEQGKQFDVKFVVGTLGVSGEVKEALLAENEKYNDLVLLTDHLDSYHNLTRKVLRMFMWADQNVNFSYLLKADDDIFARLDLMESDLKARTNPKPLYWGFIASDNPPLKEGKWKEDNWKLGDKYLPYAYGCGYVLSSELVHRIAINADGLTQYNNEDVSVGVWLSSFDLERKSDPKRFGSMHFMPCANSQYLTVVKDIADLKGKYQRLKSGETYCK